MVTGRHAARGHGRRDGDGRPVRHGVVADRLSRRPTAEGAGGRSGGTSRRDRPRESNRYRRRLNVARAVAFSSDSTEVVAGADDGMVWTWDAQTGAPAGHTLRARRPRLRPCVQPGVERPRRRPPRPRERGRRIGLRLEAEDAALHGQRDDGPGLPGAVAFSPDGTVLATGGGNGDVRFWNAATGAESGPRVVTSAGWVLDLAWSPSGKTLVSSGTDGTARLIDVASKTVERRAARSRERLGRCDGIAGRLARVRRLRERPGLRLVDRSRRLGEGRVHDRRSEPDKDGMGPVPAEPTVRPRLHSLTR